MKQLQYTVRGVNPAVDKELRRLARARRRSLNEVTLEVLQKGLGLDHTALEQPQPDLTGLAAFDKAKKRPSKLDPNKSIKQLYRESMAKKYGL